MESVEPVRGTGTDRSQVGAVAALQQQPRSGADGSRSRADNNGGNAGGHQRHTTEEAADEAGNTEATSDRAGRDIQGTGAEDVATVVRADDAMAAREPPVAPPPGSQLNVVFGGRPMAFTDVRHTEAGISAERVEFDARVIENNADQLAENPDSRFWINSGQRRFRATAPDSIIQPGVEAPPPNSPAAIGRQLYNLPDDSVMPTGFTSALA